MKSIQKRGWGLALVALMLTLACVPCAFAADDPTAGVEGDSNFTNDEADTPNSASTTITFGVKVDQITASVPLKMTVVAKANGGPIVVPSTGSYVLKNKSPMAIHVASVTGDLLTTSSVWKFGTADYTAGTDPADATKNEITFKLNTLVLDGTTQTTSGTSWNVAAGSTNTPTPLDLKPTGFTSKLNTETTATDALKITYVIAPGSLS